MWFGAELITVALCDAAAPIVVAEIAGISGSAVGASPVLRVSLRSVCLTTCGTCPQASTTSAAGCSSPPGRCTCETRGRTPYTPLSWYGAPRACAACVYTG